MKKQQRNILIAVAVLLLLYFWWESTQTTTRVSNGNGNENGNGNGNKHCTNMCCSHLGNIVSPSTYPECKCPTTDYIFSNNECVARGVIGCMDATASNFNASATINAPNTCNYGQIIPNVTPVNIPQVSSHFCYTNCGGLSGTNFSSMATNLPCGVGLTANYPNSSAPNCSVIMA